MFRIQRIVVYATLLLFFAVLTIAGCHIYTRPQDVYALPKPNDVNLQLIVHVDKTDDAWPIIPHMVFRANHVLRDANVRITQVRVVEDIQDEVHLNLSRSFANQQQFYILQQEDITSIHVFLVDKIVNPNDSDRTYTGAYFSSTDDICMSFIALAMKSNRKATTLAHELGHMFTLEHAAEDNVYNIMQTSRDPEYRRNPGAVFTVEQRQLIYNRAKRFKRTCRL